jgi:hypothetical protein
LSLVGGHVAGRVNPVVGRFDSGFDTGMLMQNEGASKGILVTTSGYGKSSFEFAAGKPLELLSGTLIPTNAPLRAPLPLRTNCGTR